MFGIGFAEMLIIGVIAILFLGPDKLPEAMVQIAKFFNSAKKTITAAKSSIEEELHVSELKEEALRYKQEMMSAQADLAKMTDMNDLSHEMDELKELAHVDIQKEVTAQEGNTPYADAQDSTVEEIQDETPKAASEPEVVTFAKKEKRKKVIETDEENV